MYLLVFLHVSTRRVYLSPVTQHPDAAWVEEQAKRFVGHVRRSKLKADIVMHDNDTKFVAGFDQVLKGAQLKVLKTAIRSPNTVAHVERFIQTVRQECTDYFVVFGERHLNYLMRVFVDYYHTRRPHQGLDNELLVAKKVKRGKKPPDELPLLSEVQCESQLGGLLKHYYRKAA